MEPEELDPFDNIDDFFLPDVTKYPDTPDGLLAKELNKWVKEEHKKLLDDNISDWDVTLMDGLKDEEDEYPLIHD